MTHYPDSESTSLCSSSLMLHAYRRSNKYQFYSLWFDPFGFESTIYRNLASTLTITPLMYDLGMLGNYGNETLKLLTQNCMQ